jgi:hypothetical protein
VRGGAADELVPGLGQRDVERTLAELGALHEKAQGDGGLAGARVALEKEQGAPR